MTTEKFVSRHNGPRAEEVKSMLKKIGVSTVDELINQTVPPNIRLKQPLRVAPAMSEFQYIKHLKALGKKNKQFRSYIGLGYYNTVLPAVIQRNVLENPGWYTAYTPYQAEISQGRLEAILNFQTMVMDLTAMPVANASLLDEATASAEAMFMFFHNRSKDKTKNNVNKFFISNTCFPQNIDVMKTRAAAYGIEIVIGDANTVKLDNSFFGVLLQYPDINGEVNDYKNFAASCKAAEIQVAVATDLLALALLTPPGEWGADCVVGNSQRFGVPMGYGGPHAAFFACREDYKRLIPGRIIGVSVDAQGNHALRMALQTREQHIKRDKATSNICTAQALLAIMASMYAVYHGQEGIKAIAEGIHGATVFAAGELKKLGYEIKTKLYFDTIAVAADAKKIRAIAEKKEINFRYVDDKHIAISLDQTVEEQDITDVISVFAEASGKSYKDNGCDPKNIINGTFAERKSSFLTHPVFNTHHSESEMMRYIKRLENKDLSLVHSMISLGSCTMKLNAASELLPITWPEFANIHPFVPVEQAQGYAELIEQLNKDLSEITGFARMSFQPNSGAQGEYTGLMVIRAYHIANGHANRNVVLIPASAHGTNPASAAMAGMSIVVIKCDEKGNVDLVDLKEKAEKHKENLSCLMVTYPSTYGVYEETITDITKLIHDNGGLVYMDGANMNAQVGLTSPGNIGADVCHLNLHKTFAIPHGGGGPGMGPIGVVEKLVPFLPSHPVINTNDSNKSITAVSAAPYGSALILLISYGYVKMLGNEGLKQATETAILNANYIKESLKDHYKILYTGKNGRCAHELILDCNDFKMASGIEVADIAKRLMDFGFHAPTVAFPVVNTLMVEPTESENKAELDRFCEAMITIRNEVKEIEEGKFDKTENVIKNAPHTVKLVVSDEWKKPYSRQKAAYPLHWVRENKFWPSVGKVDNAYGDRNLVCSCPPMEAYADEAMAI